MLADQRLRHAERVDQLVHAALGLVQLQHDRDPDRCGQRAQQLTGGVENLARRWRRQLGGVAVLVLADQLVAVSCGWG